MKTTAAVNHLTFYTIAVSCLARRVTRENSSPEGGDRASKLLFTLLASDPTQTSLIMVMCFP